MAAEPKLVIASPLFGIPSSANVHWAYAEAMLQLIRDAHVERIPGLVMLGCDLTRARSRAVRLFLESDGTHLLFWDSDVVPTDLRAIGSMIASGRDVIGLPYPRKRMRWSSLTAGVRDEQEMAENGRQVDGELETLSVDWTTRPGKQQEDGTILVSEVGMGFTMMSRSCLERMVEHFGHDPFGDDQDEAVDKLISEWQESNVHWREGDGIEALVRKAVAIGRATVPLNFIDDIDGKKSPTVALFHLMFRDGNLAPEDYSFCYRWRDLGGQIFILPIPCRHIGSHVFGETF